MREGGPSIRWLAFVAALLTMSCEGSIDRGIDANPLDACGMPEMCNQLDDDCDGMIDEDSCDPGDVCHETGCLFPCDSMGNCTTGFTCISYADGLYCLRISP